MNKPSVKTLMERLNVTKKQADDIRWCLCRIGGASSHSMMEKISEIIGAFGVEYIQSSNGEAPLMYVNMGDTYSETIVNDMEKGTLWCCSWGVIVEGNERRFMG